MPTWAWFAVVGLPDDVNSMLQNIQSDLFTIGTQIATPEGSNIKIQGISDEEVANLEHELDALENTLPPLRQFILPGGFERSLSSASGPHRSPSRRTPLRHAVSIRENRSAGSFLPEPAFRSLFFAGSLCDKKRA